MSAFRKYRLVVHLLLLASPLLSTLATGPTASARAARPHSGRCLPPKVGTTLGELMRLGLIAGTAPTGWKLSGIRIHPNRIHLDFADRRSRPVHLVLREGDPGPGRRGRWFSTELSRPAEKLSAPERTRLLSVVALIERAFPVAPYQQCSSRGAPGFVVLKPWRVPWLELGLGLVALGLLLGSFWAPFGRGLATAARWGRALQWPLLLGIVGLSAALLSMGLDVAFESGAETQRLFHADRGFWEILIQGVDHRHPPLHFLLLNVAMKFGLSEWILRLPALIFMLGAQVVLFALARRFVGVGSGLLAAALLGVSPTVVLFACDVSNWTLFLTTMPLSCYLLLRCLDTPTRRLCILWALSAVAMLGSNYMGLLIAFSQGVVLLLHARDRRYRELWYAVIGASLLALPLVIRVLLVLGDDNTMREQARQFPTHVWGNYGRVEFLRGISSVLLPPGIAAYLYAGACLAGVALWVRRYREPLFALLLSLVVSSALFALVGVSTIRLKPYYLMYLQPWIVLLVVTGLLGFPRRPNATDATDADSPDPPQADRSAAPSPPSRGAGPWLGRAHLAVGGVLAVLLLVNRWHNVRDIELAGFTAPERVDGFAWMGRKVKQLGGADTVVVDVQPLYTPVLFYFFPDPLEIRRRCRFPGRRGADCTYRGRRLKALVALTRLTSGWEAESVRMLRGMRRQALWFLHHSSYPNQPLLSYVEQTCVRTARRRHLTLYRCHPRRPGARPSPPRRHRSTGTR